MNGTYNFNLISSDLLSQATYLENTFEIVDGIADNQAPTLVSLTAPETLLSDETLTLNFELTDESGVESVYAYIARDGFFVDLTTMLLWAEAVDFPSAPISGDLNNGMWQQSFKMMEFAPTGTYTIWYGVVDIYGNRTFTTGPSLTYVK